MAKTNYKPKHLKEQYMTPQGPYNKEKERETTGIKCKKLTSL